MKTDFNKIKNLIVKRALQRRKGDFIFCYSEDKHADHTDHTESCNYSDKSIYEKEHVDYCDYHEFFLHNDSNAVVHQDYLAGSFQDPDYDDWFKPHPDSY